MSDHEEHGFSSTKVFLMLLALTAIEVLLSLIQVRWMDHPLPKYVYWAGLGGFAFWKGLLIYSYFMHMKFEGWIVKGLIMPTPILIVVVLAALTPDIARNSKLTAPVGYMVDPSTGVNAQMNDDEYRERHGGGAHEDHGAIEDHDEVDSGH